MKELFYVFCTFLLLFILSGCNNQYQINVINDEKNIYINESFDLDFSVEKNGKTVDLDVMIKADEGKIIKLEDKKITGLKEGEAVITISLKEDSKVFNTLKVIVMNPLQITSEDGYQINIGHNLHLRAINFLDAEDEFLWTTSNAYRAQVNAGVVIPLREGEVDIFATSKASKITVKKTIVITDLDIEEVEVSGAIDNIQIGDRINIKANIYPSAANQQVIWSSSNELVVRVNNEGELLVMSDGEVVITAQSVKDPKKQATLSLNIDFNPIKILKALHVEKPLKQSVTTYGYNPDTREQMVYGSVNKYFNSELNLIEEIIPINESKYTNLVATQNMLIEAEKLKLVRPGIKHVETKYIIYHDTGNHSPGANALAHAKYMVGDHNKDNRARSWHYTVDENSIIHHIPDNEVSWQGDSYEAYAMGIGIETCVDFGSDLYATWQRTAKLIAKLMVDHNLGFESIKQHNYFNDKECPQTLRRNDLYDHAIDLVLAEYLVLTKLKDYKIEFVSLNHNIVDNRGRVVNPPTVETVVEYKIIVSNDKGYNESIVLSSKIPAI